ncbi:MAG: hypothetical protein ISR73_07025 [Gammaproteobacteria bacterium]|nr:hypothetical protein [Gammaproteobacteria bacterium]
MLPSTPDMPQDFGYELELDEVWRGSDHEKGAFLYDEWDCTRKAHRKNDR